MYNYTNLCMRTKRSQKTRIGFRNIRGEATECGAERDVALQHSPPTVAAVPPLSVAVTASESFAARTYSGSFPASRKRRAMACAQKPRASIVANSDSDDPVTPMPIAGKPAKELANSAEKIAEPSSKRRRCSEQLALDLGIDHNKKFQQVHRKNNDAAPKGHWGKFLSVLDGSSCAKVDCKSCLELLASVEKVAEQAAGAAAPASEARPVPHTPEQRKRGRPLASDVLFSTVEWLREYRADVYTAVPGGTNTLRYFCKLCQHEVNFYRHSSLKFVHKHEQAIPHGKSVPEQRFTQDDEGSTPIVCQGVLLNEDKDCPLGAICESIKMWMEAGQPRIKHLCGEKRAVLEEVSFQMDNGGNVHARSLHCQGLMPSKDKSCGSCMRVTRQRELLNVLCEWAYKIDMARLAFLRFYQTKESKLFGEKLAERDYNVHALKASVLSQERESLLKADTRTLCQAVNAKFESIPKVRRTEQLQAYMDRALVPCHLFFRDAKAVQAHSAFVGHFAQQVASGEIREEDLNLACMVAAGKFREDAVVHGLFQAFMDMVQKRDRGCQRICSSNLLKEEYIFDMLSILGRHKEVKHLFEKFGVRWKATPQLPLRHYRLPDFFCAMRDTRILQLNAQLCLHLLKCSGEQAGVILMDETCYRADWEQAALREDVGVIGGPWSSDPEFEPCLQLKEQVL